MTTHNDQAARAGAWIPAGMAPTPEMLTAGRKAVWISVEDPGEFNLTENEAAAVWAAMLAAAPAVSAPAALKPLTDYQIVRIYGRPELAGTRHKSGTEKAIAIARAIEAAHGIQAPATADGSEA